MMYSYKRENNINEIKLERLVKWYKGGKAPPIQLDAEIHRRCNLNCIACPRQANDYNLNKDSKKKELGKKKWIKIVKEASDLGVIKFNIEGGGEPTAAPEMIYPIMEEIKKQNMYGIITTNGTLLNNDRIEWLVKLDWDRIHFSLDSYRYKEHDNLRHRKGAFKKTIETIKTLNKYKKEHDKEHPMLNINTIISKKNYDKLPEIVEMANELEADYLFTEPLMVFCETGEKLKIDTNNRKKQQRLEEAKKRAKELADKYNIDNNFATKDENLDKNIVKNTSKMSNILKDIPGKSDEKNILTSPCLKPWRLISVKYDGKAGHCGMIQEGVNIKDKTLEDIWYGNFLEKVRETMSQGALLSHCDNCIPSDITQRKRFIKDLKQKLQKIEN